MDCLNFRKNRSVCAEWKLRPAVLKCNFTCWRSRRPKPDGSYRLTPVPTPKHKYRNRRRLFVSSRRSSFFPFGPFFLSFADTKPDRVKVDGIRHDFCDPNRCNLSRLFPLVFFPATCVLDVQDSRENWKFCFRRKIVGLRFVLYTRYPSAEICGYC